MRDVETLDLVTALAQTARRDKEAFAALYRHAAPSLYGLALRMTRNPSCTEEIVREIFIKLWSREVMFDATHGAPLAWLQRMARNRALDIIARHGRKVSLPKKIKNAPNPTLNAFDKLVELQGAPRLRACLESLSADQRQAILLAFFEGATHEEVAEHFAVPIGTAESWIRRGLLKLKGCLAI